MDIRYKQGYEKNYKISLYRESDGSKKKYDFWAYTWEQEARFLRLISINVRAGYQIIDWKERWEDPIPF